jgi:molybdate transport system substrate-binding protein
VTRLAFISAGAAQSLVERVAQASGIEASGSFGAVGAMLEKLDAGAPADVVILTRKQVDALASQGRVRAETVADLGRVATAVAVRAGEPVPDVASGPALRAALLAADAIFFPDPAKATAGIHFEKVLESLGIRGEVAGRIRNFPNGATSMREMAAAAGRPIGCTQATEILATPGVRLVAPLPPGFDLETVYTAAVSSQAADRRTAAEFVARVTGEATRAQRVEAGFL